MCGPGGEIADVVVRCYIAYRNGEKLYSKKVNTIAQKVDPRFEMVVYTIPKKELLSNSYQESLKQISCTKKPKKDLKFIGTYLLIPYDKEKSDELYEFLCNVMLAGNDSEDGNCIFEAFWHQRADSARVILAYCDQSLRKQINFRIPPSHYWYIHTNGKEGEHVEDTWKKQKRIFEKYKRKSLRIS